MNYLKDEIKLLHGCKFREDIQQAINSILDGYNKVYTLAVNQQQYIKGKRPEFAREMEENLKLIDRNKFLEDENKRFKNLNKEQVNYIKKLEKEIRRLKKLLPY